MMPDAEADEITGAARYERSGERRYRAGHHERDLTVKAGRVLAARNRKGCRVGGDRTITMARGERREALIDMYLAGVSTRQVDDVSQLLWGDRMPSQTLSDKLKKACRRHRRMAWQVTEQDYPYPFMDGVVQKVLGQGP